MDTKVRSLKEFKEKLVSEKEFSESDSESLLVALKKQIAIDPVLSQDKEIRFILINNVFSHIVTPNLQEANKFIVSVSKEIKKLPKYQDSLTRYGNIEEKPDEETDKTAKNFLDSITLEKIETVATVLSRFEEYSDEDKKKIEETVLGVILGKEEAESIKDIKSGKKTSKIDLEKLPESLKKYFTNDDEKNEEIADAYAKLIMDIACEVSGSTSQYNDENEIRKIISNYMKKHRTMYEDIGFLQDSDLLDDILGKFCNRSIIDKFIILENELEKIGIINKFENKEYSHKRIKHSFKKVSLEDSEEIETLSPILDKIEDTLPHDTTVQIPKDFKKLFEKTIEFTLDDLNINANNIILSKTPIPDVYIDPILTEELRFTDFSRIEKKTTETPETTLSVEEITVDESLETRASSEREEQDTNITNESVAQEDNQEVIEELETIKSEKSLTVYKPRFFDRVRGFFSSIAEKGIVNAFNDSFLDNNVTVNSNSGRMEGQEFLAGTPSLDSQNLAQEENIRRQGILTKMKDFIKQTLGIKDSEASKVAEETQKIQAEDPIAEVADTSVSSSSSGLTYNKELSEATTAVSKNAGGGNDTRGDKVTEENTSEER